MFSRSTRIALKVLQAIGSYAGGLAAEASVMRLTLSTRYMLAGPEMQALMRKKRMGKYESLDLKYLFKEKQRTRAMLFRLKKQGLIKKERIGTKMKWLLTRLGRDVQKELEQGILPDVRQYRSSPSRYDVLVIFDIPEEQKHKRAWLRSALRVLGFKPLQKSVWRGNTQLPKDFIQDLEYLDIDQHIHIFTVHIKGTL